jgi:hypothetical protein
MSKSANVADDSQAAVLLTFDDLSDFEARSASRSDLEKEVIMCFDFRRARSHPLDPTIIAALPGRGGMYTPE